MVPHQSQDRSFKRSSILVPLLVLGLGVGLSVLSWWLVHRQTTESEALRFARLKERLVANLQTRLNALQQVTYHGGAYLTGRDPSPEDWRHFYEAVNKSSPVGLVGVGFIQKQPREALPLLEQKLSAAYGRPFVVEAGGGGPEAYVVTLLEPMRENAAALGKDLTTGRTRRSAAEQASRSGSLVISRRINVVYGDKTLPGFLAFYPVYNKSIKTKDSQEREAATRGWVYVSLQIEPLFTGLRIVGEDQLDYDFFEGEQCSEATLLFSSSVAESASTSFDLIQKQTRHSSYSSREPISFLERTWTVQIRSKPDFDRLGFDLTAIFVLVGGILLSALGASLSWSLLGSRDRARAEAALMTADLRRSEQLNRRLAMIAARTAQGVVLSDLEKGVEWVNDGFTRITGYTLDQILGRRPSEVLAGKGTDRRLVGHMQSMMRLRKSFDGEFLAYTKAGEELWLRVELQYLGEEGVDGGATYMAMLSDVTERVRTETQLRQAKEDADLANKAKGAFLAVMSHEIRTPLNGVIGMTTILEGTPLSEEQQEFVSIIRTSGETLLTLINDILDFSKIESGNVELEAIPFQPRVLLGEVLDLMAGRAHEKKLDLLFEVDGEVPGEVVADPTRLRQILLNLMGNAIKFTEHGEVEIHIGASLQDKGRARLDFSVRDTGVGISKEAQGRLFQSFSQADASTTRRYGGTGLGLAISKRLAEQMGGHMGVESTIGHGSTFFFSIEVTLQEVDLPLPFPRPAGLEGKRVLLVDDNATSRRILAAQLHDWGMHARCASGALEALQWIDAHEVFDVVLIDQYMPDMDGVSLGRELQRREFAQAMPLILMSSLAAPPSTQERSCFAAVFSKPARCGQLSAVLEQIFRPV